MITTKRKHWSFLNAQSIMGHHKQHYCLKIKAIYLGKYISQENRYLLQKIAKDKGYFVYNQKNDYNDIKIMFQKERC